MAKDAGQSEEVEETNLRKALNDLIRGCSKVVITPKESSVLYKPSCDSISGFAKHFGLKDQIHLDEIYNGFFKKASDKGLPTKKESINRMYENGDWTEEEEKWVASQKIFLENLKSTKAKLAIKSQADQVQKSIDNIEQKLLEKEKKRLDLIGNTCEQYANMQLNSYTMMYCMFKDEECTKKLFDKEDEEYLDHSDISLIVASYNKGMQLLSLDRIKKLSVSPFFVSYFSLVEDNPGSFFGKDVHALSFYQLNLLSYAKVLRSIIKNTGAPKHMHEDPDRLFEWAEKGENARKLMEKADASDNFSVVGAEKDDYKEMGVERKGKNIFDKALEKNSKNKQGKPTTKNSGELGIMDFLGE